MHIYSDHTLGSHYSITQILAILLRQTFYFELQHDVLKLKLYDLVVKQNMFLTQKHSAETILCKYFTQGYTTE